ncbi:MAG: hypothetical protein O2807_07040 [bacterium]|nr:hypothetical protein [bacterium]
MDVIAQFLYELFFAVSSPELLLIGLVTVFLILGFLIKIRNQMACSGLRRQINEGKQALAKLTPEAEQAKGELNRFLQIQKTNMVQIDVMKRRREELSRMPVQIKSELQELIDWCNKERVSVNFEKKIAAKRTTPKGRQM